MQTTRLCRQSSNCALAQPSSLYDIQVPSTGINRRFNVSRDQLDGLCLGRYLLFGQNGNNEVRITDVQGQRPVNCNPQRHLQNHILLQGEEAFEFNNQSPLDQKWLKVDLTDNVYIIKYENEQVLQGLSQVFTWVGLNSQEYLFVL